MTQPEIYLSNNQEETEKIGADIAKKLCGGEFLAFYGDLGSGKTAFIRGMASVLCPGVRVSSPTYAIVNVYKGNPSIFHFDMYRITDDEDLYSTGFYDYLDMGGVICAEWSENIPFAIPDEFIKISFEKLSDTERKITVVRSFE